MLICLNLIAIKHKKMKDNKCNCNTTVLGMTFGSKCKRV